MWRRLISRRSVLRTGALAGVAGVLGVREGVTSRPEAAAAGQAASDLFRIGEVRSLHHGAVAATVDGVIRRVPLEGFPEAWTAEVGDQVMIGPSFTSGQVVARPVVRAVRTDAATVRLGRSGWRVPRTAIVRVPKGLRATAQVTAFLIENPRMLARPRAVAVLYRWR